MDPPEPWSLSPQVSEPDEFAPSEGHSQVPKPGTCAPGTGTKSNGQILGLLRRIRYRRGRKATADPSTALLAFAINSAQDDNSKKSQALLMNGSGKSRFPAGMTDKKANATTGADPFISPATRGTRVGLLRMTLVQQWCSNVFYCDSLPIPCYFVSGSPSREISSPGDDVTGSSRYPSRVRMWYFCRSLPFNLTLIERQPRLGLA